MATSGAPAVPQQQQQQQQRLKLMLPLLGLAGATAAAFAVAIHAHFASLSALWTQCSSSSSSSGLPTPLCFTVLFFRAALASSTRARLEEAAIIAFLAALATITAVERARLLRRPREEEEDTARNKNSDKNTSLSMAVVQNPTVPWLLYNMAAGAFAWLGIIIPAHLLLQQQHHQDDDATPAQRSSQHQYLARESLVIALGLVGPSSLMLVYPSSAAVILAWLVFPVWMALLRRLLPHHHYRLWWWSPYALPVVYSAASHLLLLAAHILPPTTTTTTPTTPTTTRAALLLLEIDHAAIFAAVLYWVLVRSGLRAVAATVAASLVLGPGAGVCLAWAGACAPRVHAARPAAATRRSSGKATGHFFGGPLADGRCRGGSR